jgi:type I restriction enzyme S subunit
MEVSRRQRPYGAHPLYWASFRPDAPEEWTVKAVMEMALWFKGKLPSRILETYCPGSKRYLLMEGLRGGAHVYTEDTHLPSVGADDSVLIADGSKSGFAVRGVAGVLGSTLLGFRAREGTHPSFLFHLLSSLFPFLNAATTGTAVPHLDQDLLCRLPLSVPRDPDERAAIARVLDAADTALQRTHAAVERAQDLRRGLLQAAFEFALSKEPKKRSDAGLIPQSWDAIKGKNAFVIVTGGCSSVDALRLPRNGEAPDAWFMKVDDFNLPSNRRTIVHTKIGFPAADNRIFKLHPPGTLIIAKRGAAILKNRVRTTAVPIALDPNLMALQVLPGIRPEFLRCQLGWRNLSRYVESSGVPQLNNKDLYPRYFLRAPDEHQRQIVETIAAAEAHEDALVAKCEAYEALKKSLMHDLLTGRVRVKSLAETAAS